MRDLNREEMNMGKAIPYADVENAFMFASMGPVCSHSAILCRDTGQFYYTSDMGDSDELPDDVDDAEKYIELPHKNDLDLGKKLALDFAAEQLAADFDHVADIFRRKGAYARFKDLLEQRGLLDAWHKYETERSDSALRQWCADNGIEITE
jgi:hypothetical protein